jgi:hypothetical protein
MVEGAQPYGADSEGVSLSQHVVVANLAEALDSFALQEPSLAARVISTLGWNARRDIKIARKWTKTYRRNIECVDFPKHVIEANL